MKAFVQIDKEGLDNFILKEIPTPKPPADHVLIQVRAAALNPVDLKRGHLSEEYPVVVGYDVAGIVEAVGEEVKNVAVGDRVFGNIMRDSMGQKFSGTIAEYCISPADLVYPIPEGVTFEQAAALPVAALTTIQCLEYCGCKEGDKVFISGGAGGVGIHALQIAKNVFKAGSVATTASSAKFDFVCQYGADVIVDYRNENVGEKLKGWADVVLDCVGDVETSQKVVKPDGKMSTIVDVSSPSFQMLQPSTALMQKLASILVEGKLSAVIDSEYPLDQAPEALKQLAGGRAKGKFVIKVSS